MIRTCHLIGRMGVTMKKLLTITLIVIISVFLGACTRKQETDGKTVDVYYIDSKSSGIVSEKYELIATDPKEQVMELLYMLKKQPKNLVYKSSLPDDITYTTSLNSDKSLTIDFDSVYYSALSGVSEVLCRAAIVKTLCQIKGVECVQINVNGSPLVDSNNVPVGTLSAEDFIDNIDAVIPYKVKLFFANKEGNALQEYDTDINYTGSTSIEELAIQQLINGPTKLGMYNTIPEGTVLLNVSKGDGICTVDFNEKFLNKLPNIDEDVAIYSVVNTLVELPDINKVQFTINSKVEKTYWEDMPFDILFERNLDLNEK